MENRLFIRNIAPSVKLETLQALFDSVGDIVSSAFGPADEARGLKTAYIQMRTPQGAADSIARMHGYVCEGRALVVTLDEVHQPKPQLKSKPKLKAPRKGRK